jgi:hypothetical protein
MKITAQATRNLQISNVMLNDHLVICSNEILDANHYPLREYNLIALAR